MQSSEEKKAIGKTRQKQVLTTDYGRHITQHRSGAMQIKQSPLQSFRRLRMWRMKAKFFRVHFICTDTNLFLINEAAETLENLKN